jgi:type II secretory pathway pseudopilin PulG
VYGEFKTNRNAGYSLLELLVSLGVMMVITGAVFALMGGSIRFANSAFHLTEAEQSLRAAHELINRDLTSAGDGLKSIGTMTVPLSFATNYLTRTTVVDTTADPNHHQLGLVTSDDAIPANTTIAQASPAANFLANTDRISMLIQDKTFNNGNSVTLLAGKITVSGSNTNINVGATNIGLFQVGEIYAVVSQSSAAFGIISSISAGTNTIVMTNGDGFGLNQTGGLAPISAVSVVLSGASTQNTSIIRLQIIQYYVTDTGFLMRRVFGVKGGSFTETPVAEHVTNLQFRYTTNLPDANGFVTQPVRVVSTPLQQSSVREVETTIAVETLRAVNAVTNSNSISTICGANPNGKQNICSTTATTVRNMQFGANARE